MASAGGGARDVLFGCVPEDATPQAAGARYFAMDAGEDVGEAPAARRPALLLEVLPAGAGSAAHRRADRRPSAGGPTALHGRAADGGTVGGHAVSS